MGVFGLHGAYGVGAIPAAVGAVARSTIVKDVVETPAEVSEVVTPVVSHHVVGYGHLGYAGYGYGHHLGYRGYLGYAGLHGYGRVRIRILGIDKEDPEHPTLNSYRAGMKFQFFVRPGKFLPPRSNYENSIITVC